MMKQTLKTGTVLALIVIGMLLALLILYKLMALLIIVLIALVFTAGIDPMVTWLQRVTARWFHLPRTLAALLVMLTGALIVLGIFTMLTFTAVNETAKIVAIWPELQGKIIYWITSVAMRFNYHPNSAVLLQQLSSQSERITSYLLTTTAAIFGFIGGLFTLTTLIILTLFFTVFKEGIVHTFLQLVPPQHHQRAREVSHLAFEKMGGWLRGQLLLALIVAVVTMPAMLLIGVPYPALIGLIAGLGELVPMLGPYLGAVPAILIALLLGLGWGKVLLILIFFILLSQTENYLLFPRIMARHVNLSPVTTIIALLAGGSLFGIVGALLAIPLTAASRVIMLEVVFPAIQGKPPAEIELREKGGKSARKKKKKSADATKTRTAEEATPSSATQEGDQEQGESV
ncbi:MAG TPA: AI-2E family transporter [Armatimonadota bacterium]|jgi:predicted PurR-regulated permease PerM